MPTVTLNSPNFPVGTSVGIYPRGSRSAYRENPPNAAVIASATVDAAGLLTVTDAGILSYTDYMAYALVNGEHRYARVRSTLDAQNVGRATGTGDTVISTAALTNVSAATGAFAVGQRVTGPGIPPGTFLVAGSGASWTMSGPASASGTGVAIEGHGAAVPRTAIGAAGWPSAPTKWRARVMQRRSLAGTS